MGLCNFSESSLIPPPCPGKEDVCGGQGVCVLEAIGQDISETQSSKDAHSPLSLNFSVLAPFWESREGALEYQMLTNHLGGKQET